MGIIVRGPVQTLTRSCRPPWIRCPSWERRASTDRYRQGFPYDGRWFGVAPSGTCLFVSIAGYFGLTIGWVEGAEVNFLGAVRV